MSDLNMKLEIAGSETASGPIQNVTASLSELARQAKRSGDMLRSSLGGDGLKALTNLRGDAEAFGVAMVEASERGTKALRAELSVATELRDTLRQAAAEYAKLGSPARAARTAATVPAADDARGIRNAAGARPTSPRDALRGVRSRWGVRERSMRAEAAEQAEPMETLAAGQRRRISVMDRSEAVETRRQRRAESAEAQRFARKLSGIRYLSAVRDRSERIEQRQAERQAKAEAATANRAAKVEAATAERRMRDIGRAWRLRERSEAAEARHVATMRREREAVRRRAMTAGRHAYGHAHHAIRSVNHPALESAGFWITAGAAFGVEAGRHLLEAARSIDAATTRFRMMPGVSAADSAAVRANALREGMRIGLDPSEVVRLQTQAMKDGLSKDIAASLPAIINAAAQTMGGTVERDGDELAKAVREASTVGWVKDAPSARSLMNQVAGLSTFNGNGPEKMQQFLASGGIGRGKELGWSQEQTLAFGAALNGSGERTGLGSARLMAQIPEIRAGMRDRYVKATRSHENSEENRITRAAPRLMGYGGIGEMQQAFASPEGVTDFLSRMSKLPEPTRAAIEKGYGLGPQFNAVSAEMGADNGARYHQALKREQQLSSQTESNDDLSKNSKTWSGSIDFMVGQLKASVSAIQSELGDIIKDDILTPFTGWWVSISEAMLNGGMKADLHNAIQAFVHGLGFSDLTAALNDLRGSVGGFDLAGFARGIGEGVRTIMDDLRAFSGMFGGAGGLSAETVGKLATEFLGLSLALRFVAPVVSIVGGIASAFLALRAALQGAALISELTGFSAALKGILGAEVASSAAGLLSFAGALGVIGAAVQALMSAGVLNHIHMPKDMSSGEWDETLWGKNADGTSARPAWVDRVFGTGTPGPTTPEVRSGPHGGVLPRYATGGLIRGPGSGTSDSIIAAVSNREFVVNAAATAQNLPLLEALNSGRPLPAFATGGHVGGITSGSLSGFTGGSSAGDAGLRAMIGTERGVAGLRDGLQLIAELLRDHGDGFGHRMALVHGEVQPADTGADAVRALLSRLQILGGSIKAAAAGADLGAGLGSGGGAGAPNLRYGRGGDGGRGGDTPNVRYGRQHGGGDGGGGGRYRGTPIPDAPYNGKNIDGLSERGSKQFAAILGKRESGNRYNIENSYGYVGRWQMGANALAENGYVKRGTTNRGLHNPANWTGKGDVHSVEDFKANKGGVQDTEFGEYTNRHFAQLKAAGVIREGMPESEVAGWLAAAHLKGVGGAKQLARGHDNVDANGTSASSYKRMMAGVGGPGGAPGTPGSPGAPGAPGGTPEPVDPDVTKRISALSRPRALKDEECVTLAMKAVGITKGAGIMGANVHDWRKGEKAEDGNLQPGAAVSTFLDRHGREADTYGAGSPGGGGTRGAHLDHAAVFEKYITDAAGKKIGMQVAEQFKGSGGIRHRDYMFHNGAYGEANGSNYHAVKTADGKYLGGENNPMTVKVAREHGDTPAPGLAPAARTPADIARRVPTADRPDAHRGADAASPAAPDRRADAGDAGGSDDRSMTMHNVFHIHNAHDPHHTAKTVVAHLDNRMNSRAHDVDPWG